MPQDFSGQKLFGRSFIGQDLQGANFEGIETGRNLFTNIIFYIGSSIFSILSGAFLGLGIYIIAYILTLLSSVLLSGTNLNEQRIDTENSSYIFFIIASANIVFFHFCTLSIKHKRFIIFFKLTIFFVLLTSVITMISLTNSIDNWAATIGRIFGGILVGVILGGVAVTMITIGTIAFSILEQTKVSKIGYLVGSIAGFGGMASNMSKVELENSIIALYGSPVIINLLLISLLISEQVSQKNSQFIYLQNLKLYFIAWASTYFQRANLTEAIFCHSDLKYANFSNSILIRTNFYQAQNLEFAYVKSTILEQEAVRELLVHGKTEQKEFIAMDLRGAYLVNVNLQGINFTDSDFSYADLRGANLRGANLTQVQAVGVNFEGANLTGTCLEKWTINSDTSLKDIQADYVYFKNNLRKRAPNIKTFSIGEFNLTVFIKILENVYGELHFQSSDGQKVIIESVKHNKDNSLIIQFTSSEKTEILNLSKQQYQKIREIIIKKDREIKQLKELVQKFTIAKPDIYIHSQAQVHNTGQQNMFDKQNRSINFHGKASNVNVNNADNITQNMTINEHHHAANEPPMDIVNRIQTLIDQAVKLDENVKNMAQTTLTGLKSAINESKSIDFYTGSLISIAQEINNTGDTQTSGELVAALENVKATYQQLLFSNQ
ncbi:pentapeptide repeat-containing protein [Candidatus Albibeggiatoa sp. nov. BB20]|uniref:pentapeptide repeat-containing protein n=1 Tax=Candidatus Albibeggiatoa sp. nov. BB20 TaxID=3162723 RepID=UPI0033655CAF